MTRPQQFIVTSDFDAMKNDDDTTVSLTITGGTVIAAGASYIPTSSLVTVGQENATLRSRASSTRYADRWIVGNIYQTDVPISASFGTYNENVAVYLERVSPTEIRAWCDIHNYGISPITVVSSQTITFVVRTFVSPFEPIT